MKKLSILCLLFLLLLDVRAQVDECDTDDAPLLAEIRQQRLIKRPAPDTGKTFRIQVIFHVLWNTKEEKVGDERLTEMLQTLREDFLAENDDYPDVPETFTKYAENPNIQFELATALPNGKPTTGIIRKWTRTKKYIGGSSNEYRMFEQSEVVNYKRYLNVYVLDYDENGRTTTGNPVRDAVVVDYKQATGTSRTLSHETGHWLGLPHIFAGGSRRKCGDDGLDDTPKQLKHSMRGTYDHPQRECPSHPVMFMNFMDYGPERFFFTKDQVYIMRQKILKRKRGMPTVD
jgi:hypothetical protein